MKKAIWKGIKIGGLFGISMLIMQLAFGTLFYGTSTIFRDNLSITTLEILINIIVAIWSGWYSGNSFYFMPNASSGKQSAINLFTILEEKDEEQMQLQLKRKKKFMKKVDTIKGKIEIRNVSFSYNLGE
jgi:ABC-type multidrug transport system fused ATPase/permease subunit